MERRTALFLGGSTVALLGLIAMPSRVDGESTVPAPAVVPAPVLGPAAPAAPTGTRRTLELTDAVLERQRARAEALRWGRNPFRAPPPPTDPDPAEPLAAEAVAGPVIEPEPEPLALPRVSGIGLAGEQRWAILDGRVVGIGDSLPGGLRVERIERRSVDVALDSSTLTLILGDE